jgi:hypothetical protein
MIFFVYQNFNIKKYKVFKIGSPIESPIIVGGDRDVHGCIGSAGYSWCEASSKCLRIWEEKCESSSINTNPVGDMSDKIIIKSSQDCAMSSGVWYSGESLCEINSLSESQCIAKGGLWNGCASPCRHDPKAQVCIMMCALTCTFR